MKFSQIRKLQNVHLGLGFFFRVLLKLIYHVVVY